MRLLSHRKHYLPGLRIPDECRVQVSRRVDYRTLLTCAAEVQHLLQRDMREALADFIAHARTTRTERELAAEFTMDLYVFSPDEFFQIVEAEVQRQLDMERDSRTRVLP